MRFLLCICAGLVSCVVSCLLLIPSARGQDYLQCTLDEALDPVRLVTADFNLDESPDFALIEPDATVVDIVLTDRASFRAGACNSVTLSAGRIPQNLAIRDLDVIDLGNDGDMDIVLAVQLGAGVLINMGNATGDFGGANPNPNPNPNRIDLDGLDPLSVAAADFDLDSVPDMVLGTADGDIVILYTLQQSGLSEPLRTVARLSLSADDLAVADLNNDTRPDLLVTSRNPPAFQVLLGSAADSRAFRVLARQSLSSEPTGIVIAPFDGDTVMDLAITFAESDELRVFFGSLAGDDVSYAPAAEGVATGPEPSAVAAGFLDGDLSVDAVVADASDFKLRIYLNNGAGSLNEAANLCTSGKCELADELTTLALGRLDRDTLADIAVGGVSGLSFLFSSNPASTPTSTPTQSPTITPTPSSTPSGSPTQTGTETPTATPTSSVTRTVTETRTATTIPTQTCPPGASVCVQGDSCSVTSGTDGASSSPLMPLLIGAVLALLRWRSRAAGS